MRLLLWTGRSIFKFHCMNIQGDQIMKVSSPTSIWLDSKHIPKKWSLTIMSCKMVGESSTTICFNGDFSFTFSTSIEQSPPPPIYYIEYSNKAKEIDTRISWLLSFTRFLLKIYKEKGKPGKYIPSIVFQIVFDWTLIQIFYCMNQSP